VPDVVDDLIAFWRALDDRLERVEPTWWGAVVTDRRTPAVWDTNYARVETGGDRLSLAEVAASLDPALEGVDARAFHVVLFRPGNAARLLTELSTRGDRLSWDVVMAHRERRTRAAARSRADVVERLVMDDDVWARVGASLAHFGVDDPTVVSQLLRLEREAMGTGEVKHWFGVRGQDGRIVALASLVVLSDVGYIDHVVTFPEARGRGHASALVARLTAEAAAAGAGRLFLLVEPAGPVALYQRLGFREVTRIASTLSPRQSTGGGR
jgi:ribosomal protein S18 acetylase RimI-like enzyme